MADPTDFDEAPRTVIDGTPIEPEDLTDQAEVADEAAEALAVDGLPDDAAEDTPSMAVRDACGICRLIPKLWLLNEAPHPETCHGAWTMVRCCGPKNGRWAWCPLRGLLSVDGVIRDCNRRKAPGQPPGGVERRRAQR